MPDGLDCAPADMMAYAIPGEIRNVRYDTKTLVRWSAETGAAGPGTTYDIVRGPLSGLPVVPASGEGCLDDGLFVTYASDLPGPPAGTGSYILVRAANNCGGGGYGSATSGIERTTSVCP